MRGLASISRYFWKMVYTLSVLIRNTHTIVRFWVDSSKFMEFQVKFWYPSDLRLWRNRCVIYVKIDWWNSNAHCPWTCLQRKISKNIDPSTPQNHWLSDISKWGTLWLGRIFSILKTMARRSWLAYIKPLIKNPLGTSNHWFEFSGNFRTEISFYLI